MSLRMRLWGGAALVLFLALVGLNFAEFRANSLKPRVAAGLATLDPDLTIDAGDLFVSLQIFQGRVRARMADGQVRHPSLGTQALTVDSLSLDLPMWGLVRQRYQPTRVSLDGASLQIAMPDAVSDAVAEAVPTPGGQGTAEEYWGFVFEGNFLTDVNAVLAQYLPRALALSDIELAVLDPRGEQAFFTLKLDSGKQTLGTGRGAFDLARVELAGTLIAPAGQQTAFDLRAEMGTGGGTRVSLRSGALTPAHYYQFLRFARISTPERLTTAYRIIAQAQLSPGSDAQIASADLIEVLETGEDRTFAVLQGRADPTTDVFSLAGQIAGVNIQRAAPWTPVPSFLAEMDLAVTGGFDFEWNRLSNQWLGVFEVTDGAGTLAIPAIGLPSTPGGKVGVRSLSATGSFSQRGLILDKIELATGSSDQVGPSLLARLSALAGEGNPESQDDAQATSDGATASRPEITVELRSPQLQRGDLFYLWPTSLATGTRRQVATFVEAAAFTDLLFSGTYTLLPAEGPGRPPRLKRVSQQIEADFEHAQVRITPDLPRFTDARGRMHLQGDALDIRLDTAGFGPMTLEAGATRIDFSGRDWITLDIAGELEGPLSPSLAAMADGKIGLGGLRAMPLDRLTGLADGTLGLALAFNPKTIEEEGIARENIDISTRLSISDLKVRDYLLGNGVRSGSLDLSITSEGLSGQGVMDLDGVESRVDVAQSFGETPVLRVTATAQVPTNRVRQFVPGLETALDGTTQGRFEYTAQRGRNSRLGVDLDLAGVAVDFPALVYAKPAGREGRLQLDIVLGEDGPLRAENIRLDAPGLSAAGQLNLSRGGWTSLALARAQVGNSDLRDVAIENQSEQMLVRIGGGTLDLEPFLDQFTATRAESGSGPRSNAALGFGVSKPVIVERARLTRLATDLGAGAYLQNVDLNLVVADDGLRGLSLGATLPPVARGDAGGSVVARLRGALASGFSLSIETGNFGALLAALDLSRDVRDGDARITGQSAHPLGGGPWELWADADNFRLLDTPALVQVASAISLTGILEQLSGSGLIITDLDFNGTLAAPTFHVRRARLDGPSLGLSIAGAVNWKQEVLNFRGALSVLNLVNMAVRDIPLLGPLLTGAEGQGLIATQFQISGALSGVNVQVDPLSTVQPGLLRSIIDEIEGQDY